jgi:hypothetical protein
MRQGARAFITCPSKTKADESSSVKLRTTIQLWEKLFKIPRAVNDVQYLHAIIKGTVKDEMFIEPLHPPHSRAL